MGPVAAMGEGYDVAVVGTGVIGLAIAAELLARGVAVAVIGPGGKDCPGQATRAAGAMLSTFSEIEPRHNAQHTAVQTAERLAAHAMYPTWLERINNDSGARLHAEPGTWVLAPAGRRGHLEPIAAAARAAGHPAEMHDPAQIPGLNPPATSAGALWLPTEARIDSAALMDALTRSVQAHLRCAWHDTWARSVTAGRVIGVDDTEIHAQQVVLTAGTAIPGLLPHGGRPLGVPPILAGRGVSVLLQAPAMAGVEHVVRTPNAAFACGVHVVPGAEGALYVGATNRLTTTPDAYRPATLGELAVLTGQASALLDPRLDAAGLLTTRVGLRPYTLDHLPVLGRTREPTLLLATATYRSGVLLAPRVAALIADEIMTPGVLDQHPYRTLRPLATPEITRVLDDGAAADLLEHLLQAGGQLPPGAAGEFTAFAALALRALLDEESEAGAALRRLWQAAPVAEAVPSLYALARRVQGIR